MATINEKELKVYHFYGKDMVEGLYYRKADVDRLIESLKAGDNIGLPDPPKPRRATNRELARWLAQGNGEFILEKTAGMAEHYWNYEDGVEDEPANGYDTSDNELKIRKWSDTEWHEPDVDYLGLEDVK